MCLKKEIIIKKSKSLDDDFREHDILKVKAKSQRKTIGIPLQTAA